LYHRRKYKIKSPLRLLFAMGLIATTTTSALGSGTFNRTGSMNMARQAHTSTLLSNGQVLVAGGGNGLTGYLSSAELYNPATGTWTLTGSMSVPRQDHQAVRLQNGQVLVAGGDNASGPLASAELYNPSTGTWTATGSMDTARYNFSLTLLSNGEVLAAQGTSAELYNPTTGTWTTTGDPSSGVGGPNAALLQDGNVLAIGESIGTPSELYNPSTGTWSATGSTGTTIINPITPRLLNGEVFVTGGFQSGQRSYSTAALYDPSIGQFTVETGPCSCRAFNGTLLQTGKVLVAGGAITVQGNPYPTSLTINSAELWDLSTQAWTSTGNLHDSRAGESMTVLTNGQVLVAGGSQLTKHSSGGVTLSSAELYTP
jgi:Kelch motif/Galactose oxidase, central domain